MEEQKYQGTETEQTEHNGERAEAVSGVAAVPFYKKFDFVSIGELSVAIFETILQLYLLAIFLGGTVTAFGRSITVVSAMDLIFQIFNITRATIYRSVAGLVVGVGYLILACLIAKQSYETIKSFIGYIKNRKPEGKEGLKRSCFSSIAFGGIASFGYICLLIVGIRLITSASIAQQTIVAMGLVGIAVLLRRFVPFFTDRKSFDLLQACMHAATDGLILICVCLLLDLFQEAAVEKLVAGCKMLFNGNIFSLNGTVRTVLYAVYAYLAFPVLSGVLAVIFVRLLQDYFSFTDRATGLASSITKLIVFVAICTLIHFAFHSFINSNASTFNLQMIWDWIGTVKNSYLPMLILLCVWRFLEPLCEQIFRPFGGTGVRKNLP